jgi:zinc protease
MNKVKKLNTPQFWLIIITLIGGIAYLLFSSTTSTRKTTTEQIEHSPDLATSALPITPTLPSASTTMSEQSINLAINHWQTSNKVDVYFVEARELPMVDIEITFKAGSAYETQKPGVAALTNAMLDEGTKNHSNEEISETLESIGAIYNTSIDKDKSSLSLRSVYNKDDKSSIDNFNKALNIFNDLLANANFPAKNFNRIKNQAIEGLKLSHQYPETITSETFYNLVYPNHPYGIPTAGTLESVNKITRQDLVNFLC